MMKNILAYLRHRHTIKRYAQQSAYTQPLFAQHIDPKRINTVIELGARDCKDSIAIMSHYKPNRLFAFECNPDGLIECNKTLNKFQSVYNNIELIPKAVWSEEKEISFYPVVKTTEGSTVNETPNIGASSCFPMVDQAEPGITHEQKQINVPAVRLDNFCKEKNITHIDLLCMDLQGAEYEALFGLGEQLRSVHTIITELEKETFFEGQKVFSDVKKFLSDFDIELVEDDLIGDAVFGNFLFVNKNVSVK